LSAAGEARLARAGVVATLLVTLAAMLPATAAGRVLYGKKEALAQVFPDADRIEKITTILTDEQLAKVRELSGAEGEDKIVTWHVGHRGDQVLGYAYFESHTVRTLPETLLVVVAPSGEVRNLLLLAFYEPPEYEPSERWLGQFDAAKLGPDLRVARRIHGITGATLTARAVTRGVRKALALYQVLVAGKG
jgi:Na+-translocating ferredoxin:NAD+ oxidoreductase RnfG subunit